MSPEALASFIRGLHPASVATGRTLISRYDFSSFRTLVDVGGGSGGVAIAMTEACPHIRATVIELPTVLPVTKRFIEEAGATERVQVMSVDVVDNALPETYDVAVLRALIQVLSPDNALQALRNIGAAINPGGRIFVVGRVLDNSRLTPVESLGVNLVFLNIFDDGHAYAEKYLEKIALLHA